MFEMIVELDEQKKEEMEELLKQAYSLLSDVDKFGADNSGLRDLIRKWLARYEARPPVAQAGRCADCKILWFEGEETILYCEKHARATA